MWSGADCSSGSFKGQLAPIAGLHWVSLIAALGLNRCPSLSFAFLSPHRTRCVFFSGLPFCVGSSLGVLESTRWVSSISGLLQIRAP